MKFAPPVTLLLFLVPVLCGVGAVLLPAVGYFPALDLYELSFAPIKTLLRTPHLTSSILFTMRSGFSATVISCAIVFAIFASFSGGGVIRSLRFMLAPLLSVPHAAVALGIGFLFAPSGWFIRIISPSITGFSEPPLWLINPDPYGILYILALVIKEVPFLFLIALAAQNADNSPKALITAQGFGYSRRAAFFHVVLPTLYQRMRLPIYAVLAFSLTNLEVAITLAPNRPPLFSRFLLDLYNAPNLIEQTIAASAAFIQILLVLIAIAIWRSAEILIHKVWRLMLMQKKIMQYNGTQKNTAQQKISSSTKYICAKATDISAGASGIAVCILGVLAISLLPIWSFAKVWRFPAAMPQEWSSNLWLEASSRILEPWGLSLLLALAASACALVLCALCLEQETRNKNNMTEKSLDKAIFLLYLPLVIPQTSFLFGIQILLFSIAVPVNLIILIWAHMIFVLPYIFISLGDNWRELDKRYKLTAQTLGYSDNRIMFRITIPILLKPLLTAFALGIAVSIALYAPTVLLGAGRFSTITSEAIALASGGDRRLVGAFALLQAITPCFFFVLALLIPHIVWRKRAFMAGYSYS